MVNSRGSKGMKIEVFIEIGPPCHASFSALFANS